MLELIREARSGERLELVVFTFNEEKRLPNLLNYYSGWVDLVVLDGGSTDTTVDLALQAGATVYHRLGQAVGEHYFAYYTNHLTQSGFCFYLFADELIEKTVLQQVEQQLRSGFTAVLCSKAEWFYGRRMLTLNHTEPRGFRRGYAQYSPERFHGSLEVVNSPDTRIDAHLYPMHHFHLWSVQDYFGKIGAYSAIEVRQFRTGRRGGWRFFRRYVVSWLGFPLVKAWRERGIDIPRALFWTLFDLAELAIAGLTWLEQAYLMSKEEQLARYATFYATDARLD